jgi:hypothetical protein
VAVIEVSITERSSPKTTLSVMFSKVEDSMGLCSYTKSAPAYCQPSSLLELNCCRIEGAGLTLFGSISAASFVDPSSIRSILEALKIFAIFWRD